MNRREFLKGTLTAAALAPIVKLAAKAGADGDKSSDLAKGPQVTRRQYRDTKLTLPVELVQPHDYIELVDLQRDLNSLSRRRVLLEAEGRKEKRP